MVDTLARMRQIVGSTAEWAANDIVLADGEVAIEIASGTTTKIKVGNGGLRFSQLPYVAGGTSGGGGTITGVTAGYGLSGGGSTGNVTLAVNTSQIAELGDLNAYLPLAGGHVTGGLRVDGAFLVPPTGDARAPTMAASDVSTHIATTAFVRDVMAIRGLAQARWTWRGSNASVDPGSGGIAVQVGTGTDRTIAIHKTDADGTQRYLLMLITGDTIVLTDDPLAPPVTQYSRYDLIAEPIDMGTWVKLITHLTDSDGLPPPAIGATVRATGFLNTATGDAPVTGVSAGYGLTGGGASGVVSLAIDPAVVAEVIDLGAYMPLTGGTFTGPIAGTNFNFSEYGVTKKLYLYDTVGVAELHFQRPTNPTGGRNWKWQIGGDGSMYLYLLNDDNTAVLQQYVAAWNGTWQAPIIFGATYTVTPLSLVQRSTLPQLKFEAAANPVNGKYWWLTLNSDGTFLFQAINDALNAVTGQIVMAGDGTMALTAPIASANNNQAVTSAWVRSLIDSLGGGGVSKYIDVSITSNQSITQNTNTKINFDSVRFSAGGFTWDTTNKRFQVPAGAGGLYQITLVVWLVTQASDTGSWYVEVQKNGATEGRRWEFVTHDTDAASASATLTLNFGCAAGDLLTFHVWQSVAAAARNVGANAGYVRCQVMRIGNTPTLFAEGAAPPPAPEVDEWAPPPAPVLLIPEPIATGLPRPLTAEEIAAEERRQAEIAAGTWPAA